MFLPVHIQRYVFSVMIKHNTANSCIFDDLRYNSIWSFTMYEFIYGANIRAVRTWKGIKK